MSQLLLNYTRVSDVICKLDYIRVVRFYIIIRSKRNIYMPKK